VLETDHEHEGFMSEGLDRIRAERARQMNEEGWTAEHDDGHTEGELASAALCYIVAYRDAAYDYVVNKTYDPELHPAQKVCEDYWPWDDGAWRPTGGLRDLEKAGALIAAEIDRLLRKEKEV